MKRLIEDVNGGGLEGLMGQRVTLFCVNYIYTGVLTGVSATCVQLTDAALVFETGGFFDSQWKDAQKLPHDWYVQLSAVESFGIIR